MLPGTECWPINFVPLGPPATFVAPDGPLSLCNEVGDKFALICISGLLLLVTLLLPIVAGDEVDWLLK